jgi:PAS domain-containing protein
MTEAERDAIIGDTLACEHEKYIARQERLLEATRKVLAQKDLNSLLQTAADAARELTGANYAATGHGYVNGVFTAGGVSRSEKAMACPPGELFNVEKGGVYLDLIQEKNSIRLTDAEMRSHPAWSGLPEGHVPLRGLLGARLVDVKGQPNGLIMVSDKEDGRDFTAEDETILSQLAAIVSLALQHIEARLESEKEKRRLEVLVNNIPDEVWVADTEKKIALVNPAVLNEFGSDTFDNPDIAMIAGSSEVYRPDGTPRPVEEAPPLRALKGEIIRNQEEIVRTPASGELRYRQVNAAPVKDANGNIVGPVSVVRDITERKRAEEAQKKSEERFRAFITASSDVMYRMSPDWSEMRHLQGREFIPDTDSPSSTWLDKYIRPDDQAYVLSVINEAIRTKGIFELEHRVLRVDGTLG